MKIETIISKREINRKAFWDLVYEWEDEMAKDLEVSLTFDKRPPLLIRVQKHLRFLSDLLTTKQTAFRFDMAPMIWNGTDNKPNIIPLIIDFFLRDDNLLEKFYEAYSRCRIVLISSKEAYDFLIAKGCPLPIRHLALSIADKYAISPSTTFQKDFDLALLGRQNKIMMDWLKEYESTHHGFSYVFRRESDTSKNIFNYYSNKGKFVGNMNSREKFISLNRQSRIVLYSTPGIEGDGKVTHGFHQVTPHFLEAIACGCHVISKYEENSDTEFYELPRLSPNVSSYENFEKRMDECLNKEVDMNMYASYLSKHYTSVRVKELMNILKEIQ